MAAPNKVQELPDVNSHPRLPLQLCEAALLLCRANIDDVDCDTSCHERCVPRIPPDCGLVSMASLRAALDGSSPTSRKGMVESATRAVKTALSRKRTPEEEKCAKKE